MRNTLDVIKERRSIRKFKQEPIFNDSAAINIFWVAAEQSITFDLSSSFPETKITVGA